MVKREGNTASLIYDRLRLDILNGKLAPGSPLSQLSIAKTNGTSNGPVREAMRRLQQDQLVTACANHRFNVAPFDIADLEAVLGLHLANVALAIRASVPLLTDPEILLLDRHVGTMEKVVGRNDMAWEAAYRDFVMTIARHSGERTVSLAGNLIDNIQRYRANLLDKFPRVYAGGPEFREVCKAARARDGVLASTHYAEFFGRISLLILSGASPGYEASRLVAFISALVPKAADDR